MEKHDEGKMKSLQILHAKVIFILPENILMQVAGYYNLDESCFSFQPAKNDDVYEQSE